MSKREIELYLVDILESIKKIQKYTEGMSFEDFKGDEKTIEAVIRNFEVIGEAVFHLPAEIKKDHKDVPWRDISDMRNKLIHEYFGIDEEIIWKTIQDDLEPLGQKIEKIKD